MFPRRFLSSLAVFLVYALTLPAPAWASYVFIGNSGTRAGTFSPEFTSYFVYCDGGEAYAYCIPGVFRWMMVDTTDWQKGCALAGTPCWLRALEQQFFLKIEDGETAYAAYYFAPRAFNWIDTWDGDGIPPQRREDSPSADRNDNCLTSPTWYYICKISVPSDAEISASFSDLGLTGAGWIYSAGSAVVGGDNYNWYTSIQNTKMTFASSGYGRGW